MNNTAGHRYIQDIMERDNKRSFDLFERNEPGQSDNFSQPKKPHRLHLTIGGNIDQSMNFALKFNRLFKKGDYIQFGMKRNIYNQLHYFSTYQLPFTYRTSNSSRHWTTSISFQGDNKNTKYLSRDKTFSIIAQQEGSPLSFNIDCTHRKTLVDDFASKHLIMNESLPSFKNSVGVSYGSILNPLTPNVLQTATAELSFSRPYFLKMNCQRVELFDLWKNKLNLVVRAEGGHLVKLGSGRMHINDRFFINSTQCFSHLGHFQRPNVPLDPNEV